MESKVQHIILTAYTNLCRFILAGVFIFSGFVKANDPLGFQYKLGEYATAFGIAEWCSEFFLTMSGMALATIEFIIGIYLLFGINRRLTLWITLLMMLVMTPLTLYLALKNPVSDCGCFGDAIVLSNWETFWKNIILLVATLSALYWRRYIFRIVTRRSEWLISLNSLGYILVFTYYSQTHLPIFDYRPYSIGTHIPTAMSQPEGTHPPVYETLFLMEKQGEKQEFTTANYPDSSWHYVSRRTILTKDGVLPDIQDFELLRISDYEDISEQILNDEGYTFLMVAYDLSKADDSYTDLLNDLYDYCRQYGYAFYGLTATDELVEHWQDRTGGEYPFCHADELMLKTVIRANPGLVLVKDGTIINKWNSRDVPEEHLLTQPLEELPIGEVHVAGITRKIILALLWFILPLIVISVADKLYSHWKSQKSVRVTEEFPTPPEDIAKNKD